MVPDSFWIILAVCALMCSVGFYRFYYFLSVGYGLAVFGAGCTILYLYGANASPITIIMSIIFILYGLRLSGYLLIREIKSAAYRKKIINTVNIKKAPFFLKVVMWLCVSMMYVAQISPVYYRAVNGGDCTVCAVSGGLIMLIGFIIETVADYQKNEAKKANPNRFCDSGLFKLVRCPNYFGEILFWSGVLISGFGTLQGSQWILAIIGYSLITYVMLSGAKRLEHRQNDSYGKDSEYQKYANSTPILIPFIPVYHLQKYKFIVE